MDQGNSSHSYMYDISNALTMFLLRYINLKGVLQTGLRNDVPQVYIQGPLYNFLNDLLKSTNEYCIIFDDDTTVLPNFEFVKSWFSANMIKQNAL